MSDSEAASPLSWPSMLSSVMAGSAVFLVLRTSYTMGTTWDERGDRPYQNAFWTLCVALLLVSSTLAVIKFVE